MSNSELLEELNLLRKGLQEIEKFNSPLLPKSIKKMLVTFFTRALRVMDELAAREVAKDA